jgi:hypothetical protein
MGGRWPFVENIRRSYGLKLGIVLVSVVALTVVVGALIHVQTGSALGHPTAEILVAD